MVSTQLVYFIMINLNVVKCNLTLLTTRSKRYTCGHCSLALCCVFTLQYVFSAVVRLIVAVHFQCCGVSQRYVVFLVLSFCVVLASCCSPRHLQSYYTLICSAYIEQLQLLRLGLNPFTLVGAHRATYRFYSI